MSIRAGIAALNKRLEQVKSGGAPVAGLGKAMLRQWTELGGELALPRPPVVTTEEEDQTHLATLKPGSIAHQMTAQRIHNLRRQAAERGAA